jgi:acetyl esterase/lipase
MFCQKCNWGVCYGCLGRSRLPKLSEDPLFKSPHSPALLQPAFGSKALAGHGTVIVCPGGNYEFLCANEGMPVAAWLVRHGIRAFVLRYRLLPRYSFRDALSDLEEAVAMVRRCSKGPVAAIGFSAGGHLVSSLSVNSKKLAKTGGSPLDAQVLIYPGIEGSDWIHPEKNGFWDHACCAKAETLMEGQKALLGGAGFSAPPTFILGSTADAVCPPKEHSDRYVAALKKRKVPYTYLRGNFGEHGFGLDRCWTARCIPWLREQGFGAVPARTWGGLLMPSKKS